MSWAWLSPTRMEPLWFRAFSRSMSRDDQIEGVSRIAQGERLDPIAA
jgi:hypothetical protein